MPSYIPKELTKNELNEFAGDYYSEELEATYHLKMQGDSLFLYINNRQISLVEPIAADMVLTHNNGVFYFDRDEKGKIVGMDLEYFNTRMRLVRL